jgi:hypothetical protein
MTGMRKKRTFFIRFLGCLTGLIGYNALRLDIAKG